MVSPEWTGMVVMRPSVCEKYVAASDSHNLESTFFKKAHQFLSLQTGKAGHTEICWMPTSSSARLD
jgi:hypothetical protein